MKKLLATLLVATSAISVSATTLNFEDVAGTAAGNTWAAQGVTFNNSFIAYTTIPFGSGQSVYNRDNGGGDIYGSFSSTVDFLSVVAGDGGGDSDSVTLYVLDANDNVLGSASYTNMVSAQLLSVSAAGISKFHIAQQGLIAIDNFTFTSSDVPEPAMLGLFGMGAIGLGLSRRRKN